MALFMMIKGQRVRVPADVALKGQAELTAWVKQQAPPPGGRTALEPATTRKAGDS